MTQNQEPPFVKYWIRFVAAIFILGAAVGVGEKLYDWFGTHEATLQLCNIAPYDITAIVHAPVNKEQSKTTGWYQVSPGDCRQFKETFFHVDPSFYVYAKVADYKRM